MTRDYDLVVIGTGTAATVAALRCRAVGWSVAMPIIARSGARAPCAAVTRRRSWSERQTRSIARAACGARASRRKAWRSTGRR